MTFTAGTSSWTAGSDMRLKEVTGTYENALEDLKQIEAIKFRWKHIPDKDQVGVSAQSVQKVPEAVGKIHL